MGLLLYKVSVESKRPGVDLCQKEQRIESQGYNRLRLEFLCFPFLSLLKERHVGRRFQFFLDCRWILVKYWRKPRR